MKILETLQVLIIIIGIILPICNIVFKLIFQIGLKINKHKLYSHIKDDIIFGLLNCVLLLIVSIIIDSNMHQEMKYAPFIQMFGSFKLSIKVIILGMIASIVSVCILTKVKYSIGKLLTKKIFIVKVKVNMLTKKERKLYPDLYSELIQHPKITNQKEVIFSKKAFIQYLKMYHRRQKCKSYNNIKKEML